MKKILIFAVTHIFTLTAGAQCMVNAEEELVRYCHGIYLIHQELNNNVRDASLLFSKGNIYTLYLLNPSHKNLQYSVTNDFSKQGKFLVIKNKTADYQKFVIAAHADLEHKISLNLEKSMKACLLLAVYLADSLSEKKEGIYNSFEDFRQNNPVQGYISAFTQEKDVISSGKRVQEIDYYIISNKDEKNIYKRIYAFCDGLDVYMNVSSVDKLFGRNDRFVKAEKIGKYFYLKTTRIILISNVPVPVLVQLVIDSQTGEVTELTGNAMKRIIQDDPELLHEFQSESHKTDKFKSYLKRYNEDK